MGVTLNPNDPNGQIQSVFCVKEGVECWAAIASSSADFKFRHNIGSGGNFVSPPTPGMLVGTFTPDSLSSLFEIAQIPQNIAGSDGVYGLHYKGGKFPDSSLDVSVRIDPLSPASYDGTGLHAGDTGLLSVTSTSLSPTIMLTAIPTIKVASVTPGIIQSSASSVKITFNFDRPLPTLHISSTTVNTTGFPSGFVGAWELDQAGRYVGYSMTGVWQDAPGTNTHSAPVSIDIRVSTIKWLEGFATVTKTNEQMIYFSGSLTIQATPDTVPPVHYGHTISPTSANTGHVVNLSYTEGRVTVRALQVAGDLTINAYFDDTGSGIDRIQLYDANSKAPSDTWVYLADLALAGAAPSGLPNTARTYSTAFRLSKVGRTPGVYLKAYDKIGNNASTTVALINANLDTLTIDTYNQPSDRGDFVVTGSVKYITRGELADFQYTGFLKLSNSTNPMILTWVSHNAETGISTFSAKVSMWTLRQQGYASYGAQQFTIGIQNKFGQSASQTLTLDYQPTIGGGGGVDRDPWVRGGSDDNLTRTEINRSDRPDILT